MQKVANHPLLRVLKNVWIEAIIVVNISVSDCCLEMLHLLKPSSRCGEGLEKLQRLRILRQHDPSCGSMCRQSHVSGFKLQCCFCIPAKGHTGGFLHKSVCVGFVFFSPPDAYLVITAITMAALVCLFAEMVHQSVCIPLTGADVSAGRPGRDTADREDADCRCGSTAYRGYQDAPCHHRHRHHHVDCVTVCLSSSLYHSEAEALGNCCARSSLIQHLHTSLCSLFTKAVDQVY